ncbi:MULTISPECIES: DUF3857 domain-containing protein [unclassified Tenacibaculum]|uniref:DUF3857 domain-containing protein n=1 Tax=unclassified Tenacibaculum TaxID=2635139 RepID=UPI001F447CAA|nr:MULTISPECIES: DUF3857 domain-containing protein [unclassified Tenacibaculum]MCF2875461.1 DUF3857 domain-containing protein [Tenacibaculum sp. Cn5-1]MCF2935537.1 DUF3857 domain-containing protein [Tenacibaculum sp. Cn5-34]MCG7512097.1 DUF3857 domain-containing protein [Tenacibaculum sp. Cn5-46]
MKKIFLISFYLLALNCFAQESKSTRIGNINILELTMKEYEKDTTANAVVLYEHANYFLDKKRNYNKTTDYYFRIKVLKKGGEDKATIKIPFYGDEKVHSIKGITYNLSDQNKILKTHLEENEIYTVDLYSKWKEITFTLPNIKPGSVIEYKYSVTSPYSGIDDWYFQSDIPKIKSDFTAAILGNWKYKIRMIGFLKLNRDKTSVKKNCIDTPSFNNGDCLILNFGMDDIPAFKEESHMLSKENFISKLAFELESYTNLSGSVKKFTKTWKDADKNLKYNFLDNQISKKSFFKNELKASLFNIEDELQKAKEIYKAIQNHFSWNEKYWPSRKVRIKKAYKNKTGNIFDINLSLYNALQAANIKSYLVLTSTRNKAVPTKLHPVINDFNYLLVKAVINNKTYFLDATNKKLPFGLIRYMALNGDGRVMDFKKGSYWETINLSKKTYKTTKAILSFNDENELNGSLMIASNGYFAVNDREEISENSKENYIENFESNYSSIEVENLEFINLDKNEKTLQQVYDITFEDFDLENKIRISPFLINKFTKNPFKLNNRDYPIDYGFPRSYTYLLTLKLPQGYQLKKLPKNKALALPNKGGKYVLNIKNINNTINVYFKLSINKRTYTNNEYYHLKEFYNQAIKTQDVFIEIEKTND